MSAESQLLKTINQFIGPCAHGSDPYDRCEECEWLSPIEAKVVALKAEVERLRVERDEARKWLEGICVEFESTIAHAEWRAAGSKGMSVPFFGDFADAARHPGMIGRMGWWVKVFRAALKEGDR